MQHALEVWRRFHPWVFVRDLDADAEPSARHPVAPHQISCAPPAQPGTVPDTVLIAPAPPARDGRTPLCADRPPARRATGAAAAVRRERAVLPGPESMASVRAAHCRSNCLGSTEHIEMTNLCERGDVRRPGTVDDMLVSTSFSLWLRRTL